MAVSDNRRPSSIMRIFKSVKAMAMIAVGASMLLASATADASKNVTHFVFAEDGDLDPIAYIIQRQDISGVQMIYNWKQLESSKGNYTFSDIESDLKKVREIQPGKTLFVQIQDRFDVAGDQSKRIPNYLLVEPEYEGGLLRQVNADTNRPDGWQTKHWVLTVRQRFQALLSALAKQFDGRIYGLNLPETAFDYNETLSTSFCNDYFQAEMENLNHASSVFNKSMIIQYMNFWPCESADHQPYMTQAFLEASQKKTYGFGGPDVKPWNPYQLQNSYKYFHNYTGELSHVAMAVQEPDLNLTNPRTNVTYTVEDFKSFSENYLGSTIMFWTSHIFNQTYPPAL
ncbi:hypothetical protein BGZ59_002458 [Podila verticillata]|nr:hypothetical protein BGZ59_002458 [Podila verticillata]